MCGIVAILGSQCTNKRIFEAMLKAIVHRGPDEAGSHIEIQGRAVLGIQRLSIIDQQHGHQPVTDLENKVIAVGNGEIYNHKTIRRTADSEFDSGSDIEVIPYLYRQHGVRCLEYLDGMFGFVLYDGRQNTFLAARDRYGIKPLYFSFDCVDQTWTFASELKCFVAAGIDVKGIRELPAGHYITNEGISRQWYHLPSLSSHAQLTLPSPVELRSLLEQSISKHLQRDKNIRIGVFLSGGLDSSIITALAARKVNNLIAFTIGVKGSPDLVAARRVAAHLSVELVECDFDPEELIQHLNKTIEMTETYNTALVFEGYLTSILSKEARKRGVKVILSGEGADEIFGGYGLFHHLDESSFQARRSELLTNIGSTECKRLDRATMAYSVEARVPFLDQSIVAWALAQPKQTFIQQHLNGSVIDKLVLRQAVENLLPPEIVWRTKLAFDTGSGILQCLDPIANLIDEGKSRMLQQTYGELAIQDRISAYLFTVFQSKFGLVGGRDCFFSMAGNYPLMQPFLHIDEYRCGGTGEINAETTFERSTIV